MIGSSHPQLRKKNRCFVKLQGEPLNHNARKIPVEDSWIIILQNNSKCLLLNDKQTNATQDTVQFVRRNTKHEKDEHTKFEWIEIWERSNSNRVSCFNIYIVVFGFLSSTIEEDRW